MRQAFGVVPLDQVGVNLFDAHCHRAAGASCVRHCAADPGPGVMVRAGVCLLQRCADERENAARHTCRARRHAARGVGARTRGGSVDCALAGPGALLLDLLLHLRHHRGTRGLKLPRDVSLDGGQAAGNLDFD